MESIVFSKNYKIDAIIWWFIITAQAVGLTAGTLFVSFHKFYKINVDTFIMLPVVFLSILIVITMVVSLLGFIKSNCKKEKK